jgi:putative flippase GtrA
VPFLEKFVFSAWFKASEKIRFILVGVLNTLLNFIIFHVFVSMFGEKHYTLHAMMSWAISSVFAYFGHSIFVFKSRGNRLMEYIRSVWSRLITYFIVVVLVKSLCDTIELNIYVSLFITNVVNATISYILLKYFALRITNDQ